MAELRLELSKEEQRYADYLKYLQSLAAPESPLPTSISNKGKHHASILMGALLYHTETRLRMYCTGLTPTILHGNEDDSTAYWRVFQDFFQNRVANFGNNTIKIIVQSRKWENDLPFNVLKKSIQQYPGKIEVRVENSQSKKIVNKYWGKDESINFSVFDNTAYRLEYEPGQHIAIASFNDVKVCNELITVFDDMFRVADKF